MQSNFVQQLLFRTVTLAILSLGFVQPSSADMIGTQQLLDNETHQLALSRIEALLQRQDVADQLVELGVEPGKVMVRVSNLTTAELATLDGQLNNQVAGGDIVGTIGIVFVVLIILELVGVTDIFKAL